jgi:myo-inositol 2-dehydrogenase/D-chiro-inositol 1-dehydrogenase
MRVGVIGCGAVAHYCHVPALLGIRGVTVAAVADPDENSRNRAARAANCVAFKSAEFLLANADVDAVIIATPPDTHASIGTMAARAGKAIYLEKPVATAISEARDLVREVTDARTRAVVGFNRRSHALFVRARAVVDRGGIGELRAIQTTFCEPVPVDGMPAWKQRRSSGGGVLLDLASHHIDVVRWLTRREVKSVAAHVRSDESEHDSASLEMILDNDVIVQSFFSFRAGYAERLSLVGDEGTLEIDRHSGSFSILKRRRFGYGARRRFVIPSFAEIAWRSRRVVRSAHDPSYRQALTDFLGDSPDLATLHDGNASLEVVIAGEESALAGRRVLIA